MNHLLRRFLAAGALLVAALAAPLAIATPTISFTGGAFPATGSPVALASTPAGLNISVTAAPTAGATITQVSVTVNGVSIGSATGSSPFVVNWVPATAGTFTIAATVNDTSAITTGAGASTNTATINSIVTVTAARAATLLAPANNTVLAAGAQIFLRSTASMTDGIVQKVDFILDGTTTIGTATQAPYNVAHTLTAATGAHTLLARVTASDGTTTFDSSTVNFTVGAAVGTAPTVTLTGPVNGAFVATGSPISLVATATDADGFIPSTAGGGVTFFVDGDPVGTDLTAPYSVSWTPTVTKSYSIRAQAIDDKNNLVLSTAATVTAVAALPTITLTSPTTANVGTAVTVSASATASPGATITQVEFLENGVLIGAADTTAPYAVSWTPATIGTSVITARVTDTANAVVTSAAVNVTVSAALPTITFTAPSTVAVNNLTTLTATATPGTGATITQVQFLSGTTVLGTDTTAPYSFDWTPTVTGTVSLTARVTDANGTTVTSSAVSVTVAAAVPTVSITSPTNGTTVALGTTTSITANPVANGGATVSRVDFLAGATTIGTALVAPYTVTWTPTASGITALTARVTDSNNSSVTSTVINVNVTAPSVALTSPTAGSSVTVNAVTTLTATASAVGAATVTKVEFLAGSTLVGTDTTAPYSFDWTPTAIGAASLTARVTDSNGAIVTSTAFAVTVAAAGGTVPTVALTAPTAGASIALGVPTTLTANAAASGTATVSRVDFLSGTTIVGTALAPTSGSSYSFTWTPPTAGITALTARVTDSNGTTATSTAVNVNVSAPAVVLTSPTAGATVSLTTGTILTATATPVAPATVSRVEFFAGTTLVGTVVSPNVGSNYSVLWTPTNTGAFALTARVTDNGGGAATSAAVNVTVTSLPTISLTAPTAGSTVFVGANVAVSATVAAGSTGTVSKVDFFADSTLIGTDTTSPYSITWVPTAAGSPVLSARVTDSSGVTVNSATVAMVVSSPVLPTATLTAPAAGASTVVGTAVTLTATAATSVVGASIARVDFYNGTTLIGTDSTAPYSVAWTPSALGETSLFARAVDTNGLNGDSAVIAFIVNPLGSPTISLAFSPNTASAVIPVGSARVLTATVADDGALDRVEFYYDGTLLGTDRSAPYAFTFVAPLAVGSHQLTARVIDNVGNTTTSSILPIEIAGVIGEIPTGTIFTPVNNTFLPAGLGTTITGSATDNDGTISTVQVYTNGTLLGNAVVTNNQWTITWTPGAVGPVALTAIITDDKTNAIATLPTNVTVTDNTSPAISLNLSPVTANAAATTTLPAGATRNILATVTPVAGRAVSRVEFFVNGTKVSEKTVPPYSYRYTAAAEPGNYVVTVRATDNTGLARDQLQTFTVTSRVGAAPTVNLLAPTNGATVVPNSTTPLNLAASALSTGGTITSVQFYANGSPVGINGGNGLPAAPYVSSFNPTAPGSYTLDAIATDDRGNTTISNAVTITAAFGTPTVVITAPNPNATARATPNVPFTITALATAGTGAGVLLVEFLIDGQQVGTRSPAAGATASTFTSSFQWTPTLAQLGLHDLTVRVTDTNSLTATSPTVVKINVASIVGTPPTVSITAPGNGAVIQSASVVNFIANSSVGTGTPAGTVEFFLNDVSIGLGAREQATNIYRRTFDFSTFDFSAITADGNGRYPVTLYAIARDNNNNQTISNTFTLSITPAQSLPPSVQLTTFNIGLPGNTGNSVTQGNQFPLFATVADNDGSVTTIQLFANGTLVGASTITNPSAQSVMTYTANTVGTFNLIAVATDDTGNTAISSPAVILNVTALRAPTTALTRPADNSIVTTVLTPVFLEATASSPDANQTPSVGFFATNSSNNRVTITNNAQRVSPTSNVYRFVWTPTTADTYTVSSSATVGFGTGAVTTNSTQSRRVVVNLVNGISPTVSFSVQGSVTSSSTVNLIATANDSDGSVSGVEFYLNRNSIGQAVREQLTSTWRLSTSLVGLPLGNTEIVALVRDSTGNIAASPTSTVSIAAATSLAPTISSITANPTAVSFSRPVQLTANANDPDGTVSVQYFANGTAIGTGTNPNTNYLVNWTPGSSGTFNVYAVATDNGVNGVSSTAIANPITVTVRRNNPIQDDTAFILQSYSDIANTTNINPLVLADLADRLAAGSLTRTAIVTDLIDEPGFVSPVNLLAAYWVLMGQWPTPANYTTLLATTRGAGLANGINSILFSNEYFAKYGTVPTVALLNSPTSLLPADTFINRLWAAAGLGTPSPVNNVQFRSNNVASPTLGRGYNPVGLPTALAEFITNTNSTNTALFNRARAAAIYYQLNRPPTPTIIPAKEITDGIATRVSALAALGDNAAIVDAVLKDPLYSYRFVTFVKHPESLVVNPRSGAIFTVEAIGAPPILYQWLFNGTPIANATTSTLSLTNVDTSRVGTYTVVVTTTAGSATSDPATLSLTNVPTRVANISTRGVTSGGNQTLIGGFVVANPAGAPPNQTRQMLIRVVGPTLNNAPFNLTGTLGNPSLEVYNAAGNQILANDNWGAQVANVAANTTAVQTLQQATNRAGAFPLPNNSPDASILATLPPGSYTVQAGGPNANSTGVVLIEVYDATPGNANATSPRASNVATRGVVGTGNNILIAGFVINGAASRRILLRGVGPTLNRFGLGQGALLADPLLTLKDAAGNTVRTNDDWASGDDAAQVAAASVAAGAFALTNGSKDAAILTMLAPGAYTVQLSGVNNTTGIGIVEVYDVDP